MTLQEFIKKYNGKFVEMGGSTNAVNQCVDLANAYIKEVLNKPIILGTNAEDFPSKCTFCDWIPYLPLSIPEAGDIIIWDTGSYGHIAIATDEADYQWFISFDQNYPIGSKCHLQEHNYKGVIGWLRPEGNTMNIEQELSDCRTNLDIKVKERDTLTKKLGDCEINLDLKIKERDKLNALIDTIKMESEVEKDQIKKSCEVEVQKLVEQNIDLVNKYKALTEAVSNLSWKEIIQLIIKKIKG